MKRSILLLGSKEYPLGTNKGDDPLPSGGMELYVQGLAGPLSRHADVSLITRKFRRTPAYEKKGALTIHRVPYIKGFLLRNISFNFRAFMKALSLRFDVIVANDEVASLFGWLLAKLKRRPLIAVSHGLASEQPQYNPLARTFFRFIESHVFKRADAVVTHAPHQLAGKVGKPKLKVIMPGLERARLRKDRSLLVSFKPKGKVILFVGRLLAVKGVEHLLQALARLDFTYTCFIVGDGPARQQLESLAKELGANAVFTGVRDDVNRFLSIADAFVLPSLSESLSYSMLEAAYMRVPIVVTDIGILPKDCGMLVPRRAPAAIARALKTVFGNKPQQDRMVRNAYRFTQQFDWELAARKYKEVIASL
ncbi:MAG: glycosyltransferase family 4 protein [Candidatus Aenigmatarchaeota archaeon]